MNLKGQFKAILSAGATVDARGLPEKVLVEIDCSGAAFSGVAPLVFNKASVARFEFGSAP